MLCFPVSVCVFSAHEPVLCVGILCIYKQGAMCANENVFLTGVEFGTSQVLEQDV